MCRSWPAGRVWDCRGVAYRPAANGDRAVNGSHGAVTLLLGPDEQPTAAMVEAVRWLRTAVWLARYPRATEVVGHRDLHSTDCPGPRVYALVRDGTFTRPASPTATTHHQEETMLIVQLAGHLDCYLIGGPRGVVHIRTPQEMRQFAGLPVHTLGREAFDHYFGPIPNSPTPAK